MSRGQLARNSWNFPAMNDRGGRRRVRRAVARAHQFAEQMNRAYQAGVISEAQYRAEVGAESPYSRGGLIPPMVPLRVMLDTDECVVAKQDGEWKCCRTDPEHTATDRHATFPARMNWFDSEIDTPWMNRIRQTLADVRQNLGADTDG